MQYPSAMRPRHPPLHAHNTTPSFQCILPYCVVCARPDCQNRQKRARAHCSTREGGQDEWVAAGRPSHKQPAPSMINDVAEQDDAEHMVAVPMAALPPVAVGSEVPQPCRDLQPRARGRATVPLRGSWRVLSSESLPTSREWRPH